MKTNLYRTLGVLVMLLTTDGPRFDRRTDERGGSDGPQSLILIAGAIAVGLVIVGAIMAYVRGKLPK